MRLVREHQVEYETQWGAITSIASKIGCAAETLRLWVRRAERDAGQRPRAHRRCHRCALSSVYSRSARLAVRWSEPCSRTIARRLSLENAPEPPVASDVGAP